MITTENSAPLVGARSGAGTVAVDREAAATVPRVIGLDLSLSSTGVACSVGPTVTTITSDPIPSATWHQRQQRLHRLRNQILDHCRGADLIVVESPSYGSQGAGTWDRAGLAWLVLDRLFSNDLAVAMMSPAQRSVYSTGKGGSSKEACMLAAERRWPMFGITGNDTGDAAILCAAGLDQLGQPLVVMPDTHRRALLAVAWPVVMADV